MISVREALPLAPHIGFSDRNCRRMVVELEARGRVRRRVADGFTRVDLVGELPGVDVPTEGAR